MMRYLLLALYALCALPAYSAEPVLLLPKTSLQPEELAVIVNIDDGLSRAIGNYYQQRRGIPERNIIRIRFKPGMASMEAAEFKRLWPRIQAQTPETVQAYALTWALPYRVGCMSITSAFATGYDIRYCAAKRCDPTQQSAYFASASIAPYTDFKLRPTMALAAQTFAAAKALIDRGIASDHTYPKGTGYLLSTSDAARNVRAQLYQQTNDFFDQLIRIEIKKTDILRDVDDVLFYFTGLTKVEHLNTLHFVPGAIADHLTSAGGILDGKNQMSILRWLEAGATGSYGTVVEPCAFPQKFPVPGLVLDNYLKGETLIEAYWKSVAWPGEGLFVGEPLANPYGGHSLSWHGQRATLRTQALPPGHYWLEGADNPIGPYLASYPIEITHRGLQEIELPDLNRPFYRLVRAPDS